MTHVQNAPADKPYYGCSEVTLPDGRRMYLFEAIALNPEEVLGKKHIEKNGTGLGMLIKYLDAQTQYGLQCHRPVPGPRRCGTAITAKKKAGMLSALVTTRRNRLISFSASKRA